MGAPVIEILSESFVKPSTLTPESLRSYNLSYHDQIASQHYMPVVFLYPILNQQQVSERSEISKILQTGLSKTLSYYYPFAGRLRDNLTVECNDRGVHFVEARIKCLMSEFLQQSNPQVKDIVFHKSIFRPFNVSDDNSLVLVQLNHFDCSGMAVSICMSHKLGDASTLSALTNDWATMVRQTSHIPSPQFVGASIFPPSDDQPTIDEFCIYRSGVPVGKFLFSAAKIALLKDMAAKSGVKNPTRVEVVSALLYRCAMVSSKAISGFFRPSVMATFMNLRTIAELPKDSVGNFLTYFCIATFKEEETTLPELVSLLRDAKVSVENEYKRKVKANEPMNQSTSMSSNHKLELDAYCCTSLCRFPFYDVDFGLGKPLQVNLSNMCGSINTFKLMDYGDGESIEAIALLKDPGHMSAFKTNKELLDFASLVA